VAVAVTEPPDASSASEWCSRVCARHWANDIPASRRNSALAIPMLAALRFTPGTLPPIAFAALAGAALNIPFSVLIKLGQDYLPTRPGTAAGVTLGLAVSVGGLLSPLLGLVAQAHGPEGVLAVLCLAPIPALLLGILLPEPVRGGVPHT